MNRISRRKFLQTAGIGAAALLTLPNRVHAQGVGPELARLPAQMDMFMPDAEVLVTSGEKWVQILPGAQTRVWGYEGQLVSGSGVTVESIPGSYLGPMIRANKGTKVRIVYQNNLPEMSVIHPHGLRVPEECDGSPMQAIGPGETKVYDFPVIDRAGPYWFHPHPHMRTAYQVALGLAGLFYVTDPEEAAAVPGAATGANDIPVVLQDRIFDANNQIVHQMNAMWGYLGDRILVNGKVNPTMSLEPRAYRLRILNGSNARTYKLAWSNNMPLKIIGTDGGLLPAVETRSYAVLMPGERIDIWADFSALARKSVVLRSLSFSPGGGGGGGGGGMGPGGGGGGGGGGMMGTTLPNGAAFDIMTVTVGRKASTTPVLGALPPLGEHFDAMNVMNFNNPVPFTLDMMRMVWTINGRVYDEADMMAVADDEMVHVDEPIAWEWINNSPIPHPMHIHNV